MTSLTRPNTDPPTLLSLPRLAPVSTTPVDDALPSTPRQPIDLRLDANECGTPRRVDPAALGGVDLARYPSTAALTSRIAALCDTTLDRIVVTAGADDALDRICRALLDATRSAICTTPSFSMIQRLAGATGADVRSVEWLDGTLPLNRVGELADGQTAVIFVVTPNNPTGAVATMASLRRLRTLVPQATLVVDLAYVAFADEDPSEFLRDDPGIVLIRTLSKSHGLAGARIGWVECDAALATALRRIGSPYAVASPSVAVALAALRDGLDLPTERRDAIREGRTRLADALARLDVETIPSQGNFVFARFGSTARATWTADALAGVGIAVRRAPGGIVDALRITVTGDRDLDDRAIGALRAALAPEAILLDLDGVLADVSASYRCAIVATAASFGVTVTSAAIEAAKRAGDANNDWILTLRFVRDAGIETDLPTVVERFQKVYLGSSTTEDAGLRSAEQAIVTPDWLRRLASRLPVAIVTGRPRREAEWFLDRFGLGGIVTTLVAMEDAPAKPDPAPITLALNRLGADRLGVRSAWMVGDTVDDILASRRASTGPTVIPIGVLAPQLADWSTDSSAESARVTADILTRAGAAVVLDRVDELDRLLLGAIR